MRKYTFDMESYYDSKQGYTLRKMTTEEYINDPRFHCFGFSVSCDGGQPLWVPEEKIDSTLRQLKLHEHTVIMHNAMFDAAILNWKFGVKPKFIIDTLAMARGILGNTERLSLEALGERYGVGVKGDTVVHMDGVRHPGAELAKRLGEYAKQDVVMTWGLWEKLSPGFPAVEMFTIDITTRMFTEPSFELDKKPILRELQLDSEKRETLLLQANCSLEDLRSDAKFAELLSNLGVTPPKKLSVKKTAAAKKKDPDASPVYAWAFAKSDPDFKHLAESEDDLVRWACEARLGLKSTIKQSRAQRFLSIAERMGKLPIALTYYGAGTGRYAASSSERVNAQNLPAVRGSEDPDVGLLRKSMTAPKGKRVFVYDAAQIEARFVAWLAGQEDLVEAFAQGRDVYSEMASKIYRRHVDGKKNPDDYIARFLGKCTTLGAGYSMGFFKFGQTVYGGMLGGPSILFDDRFATALNVNVERFAKFVCGKEGMLERIAETQPIKQTVEEWVTHLACARKIITTYRESNPRIPELWAKCGRMIDAMYEGVEMHLGPVYTEKNAIVLPNKMKLLYKGLERSNEGEYSYLRKKEGRVQRVKIYGGALLENCSQALAGVYIKEAMVRMHLRGLRPVLQVHDEVVVIADEKNADETLSVMNECMTIVPDWAHGLPLAAEGDYAVSYGDAK